MGNVQESFLSEIVDDPEFLRMAVRFTAGEAVPRGCRFCKGVKPQRVESG